jgi:hypothetical protein
MAITVFLSKAILCVASQCFPALVGDATPVGSFNITKADTDLPGYGGDVLMFSENDKTILAIHRVWTLKPAEHRAQRLLSDDPAQRRHVTNGCINVDPEVYEAIMDEDSVDIVP